MVWRDGGRRRSEGRDREKAGGRERMGENGRDKSAISS